MDERTEEQKLEDAREAREAAEKKKAEEKVEYDYRYERSEAKLLLGKKCRAYFHVRFTFDDEKLHDPLAKDIFEVMDKYEIGYLPFETSYTYGGSETKYIGMAVNTEKNGEWVQIIELVKIK